MKLASKISLTISIFMLFATGLTAMVAYGVGRSGGSLLLMATLTICIAVGAIIAIVIILNQLIMGPIRAVSAAVLRVSLGDLSKSVPVLSGDELGYLSQSFNEMTRQLGSTHRSLEVSMQVAREERAQLVSSIEGLRQGFVLLDANNKVTLANASVTRIICGEDTPPTDSTPAHVQLDDIIQALPKNIHLQNKIDHVKSSQKPAKISELALGGRFINLYLSPVLNETQTIGCVLLLEDITEARILERSRDEFFSIASHELRTPLTAIRGNAVMIQDYYPQALKNPDVKEMVDDIHESAVRLIEIVNDFLATSSLEQNKMNFALSSFAIEKVIEKTLYEMAAISRDKHVALNFDQHTLGKIPLVYADPSRITQVVYNLIGNALKFTEKGSVTINCLVEGHFVKVCVTDTGPGITPEGKQLLFHKFQQSTSSILTRDNTRGTGLGLYISKLLVERMGGIIRLEHSQVGKGSTFSFTIPIATKAQLEAAAPSVVPRA